MYIALTGDVMLGRLVNRHVIQDEHVPPDAVWGDVLSLLLSAANTSTMNPAPVEWTMSRAAVTSTAICERFFTVRSNSVIWGPEIEV